jgi:hypothetical protein
MQWAAWGIRALGSGMGSWTKRKEDQKPGQGHCETAEELSSETEVEVTTVRKLNDWHEEIIMDTANTKSKRVHQFYCFLLLSIISIVLFLALVIWVECLLRAFALEQHHRTFPSAEQANHALAPENSATYGFRSNSRRFLERQASN